MYIFDGNADGCMAAFKSHLATATQGGIYATAYLHDAMVDLIGLQVALDRDGSDAGAVQRFRAEAAAALRAAPKLVRGYVYLAADDAEEASEPDWYQFCIRRSAIELVCTDLPAVASELFDPDDLNRLDAALRRLRPDQDPVPESLIPRGLSPRHWWWHPTAAATDDPFALHLSPTS